MTEQVYPVSVFGSDRTTLLENHDATWAELEHMFTTIRRTSETCDEWLAMKESNGADEVKAQFGCLVGGPCRGDRRGTDTIPERSLVTLDIDEPSSRLVDEVRELGCSAIIHPTHTPGRWRVVIPLERPVGRDEYRRLVAALSLRISGVDPASGKVAQVMYLPSVPADDERTATVFEAAPLDPDSVAGAGAQELERPAPESLEVGQRYDRRLLSAAVIELAQAVEGERNESLNRQAFKLAAAGALDEDAREVLRRTALSIGLEAEETDRTLDSAVRSGGRTYEERTSEVLSLFDDGRTPEAPQPAPPQVGRAQAADALWDMVAESMADTPEPPPQEELWAGRIPLGALTLVSGIGGVGKSMLTAWLAARVSDGGLDGALHGRPAPALLIQDEDDWARETVARLRAAGACPDRVLHPKWSPAALVARAADSDETVIPEFPAAAHSLLRLIRSTGARLVVLDVVTSMMESGASTNDMADVRRLLNSLQGVAKCSGAAVVAVNHWRKGSESRDYERISGSTAFRDTARSVWLVANDPDGGAVMQHDKYSFGRLSEPLVYDIEDTPAGPCITAPRPAPRGAFFAACQPPLKRQIVQILRGLTEGRAELADEDVREALRGIVGGATQHVFVADAMEALGWRGVWCDETFEWRPRASR
nr:MAG TPA: AAA domain protein [Caudoviricetes sp.]